MEAKLGARLIATLRPELKPYEVWDSELPGFLLRVRPGGLMTFFCSYRRNDGRKTRVSLGRANVLSAAQARDAAINALAAINRGIDPVLERRKARTSTLRVFLAEIYGPWVRAHRKSGVGTLVRANRCFEELMDKPLSEITAWLIEKWRTSRKNAGISAATINRDVTSLKAALSKAVEWGHLEVHPLSRVKPLFVDSCKFARFLSAGEEQALRKALDERQHRMRSERRSANQWRRDRSYPLLPCLDSVQFTDHLKPMAVISMNTGLRRGELFSLRRTDVNLDHRTLTVDGSNSKSQRSRHLPLNSEALWTLSSWMQQTINPTSELVFPGENGQSFRDIKNAWTRLLADAGISDFRWHDLRHHFASKLVMAGVDLNTVRELLGHSGITMTLRYAHLAPHVKAEAVARITNLRFGEHRNEAAHA